MGSSYKDLLKLYDVIQNGHESILEIILKDTSVEINQIIPCKGIGLLHLAVGIEPEERSKKCTELLLKHGADPNLCNEEGVTAVHIAAIWGRAHNLRLLLGCGGDPARADADGLSAFEYAAREQQWAALDYLHNVVDPADHAPPARCAYTLHLERVLLTTDQLVAEYAPIVDDTAQEPPAALSKSALVNSWCKRNSLVINKLYPTILGDTYLLDDESAPWRSTRIDLEDDITLDLTTDRSCGDTHASFKSCLSKGASDGEISGIRRIDFTLDVSCKENANALNKRISVYENFSLPGSPKTISHINYNTKSSLKKQKQCSAGSSLISSDYSQELDRVLAVAQNKTNEFLSGAAHDTRRSSASSAMGSELVLAAVREEYRYCDEDEDVVLIEQRLRVSPVVLPLEERAETASGAAERSAVSQATSLPAAVSQATSLPAAVSQATSLPAAVSQATSLPAAVRCDDLALRAELQRLGFTPGPIQDTTRNLYLKKLQALKRARADDLPQLTQRMDQLAVDDKPQKKTYSIEIEKSLRNAEWMNELTAFEELENKLRADFADSARVWREGSTRTSFTYLLLDPRRTANLPARASQHDRHYAWTTFVDSIFYVGKGKRSRPYSHLYQALTLWKKDFRTSKDRKVQRILDVWAAGAGVVCLHVFQNVLAAQAYTHEAAMIDALSLGALTNQKPGSYYGAAAAWPLRARRQLGVLLLYRALLIFLSEGERQLRPDDLD